MEDSILKFWSKNNIEKKYLDKNSKSDKRWSFIDGPITANNPMGVHHAWGRTYKDLFSRYKNMQGFKQRFQNCLFTTLFSEPASIHFENS